MGDIAGPSLLLAKQDLAHREHLHQHNLFHNRRQAAATAVVTEIVATVSVVQQVDIDINGSTYATETLTTRTSPPPVTTEDPATDAATATTAPASQPIDTPSSAAPSTAVAGSQPDTSLAAQSLLSSHSTTSASTTLSIPTSFPSLTISSNSTSCE